MSDDIKKIYDYTNDGLDIFEVLISGLKMKDSRQSHPFFREGESGKDPSSHLYYFKNDSRWRIKSFNTDDKPTDAIDYWMQTQGCTLQEAIQQIAQHFGVEVGPPPKMEKPDTEKSGIPEKWLNYFLKKKGITEGTLLDSGVYHQIGKYSNSMICFPRFIDGKEINCTYQWFEAREVEVDGKKTKKGFKKTMTQKDAEVVFEGLDDIKPHHKEVAIVEGNTDRLAVKQTFKLHGHDIPVIGVPGSSLWSTCLSNSRKRLAKMEKVYVFTDNDKAGYTLKDNIIASLGKHRCFLVSHPENDACDVLVEHGSQVLLDCFANAELQPINGRVDKEYALEELDAIAISGLPGGIDLWPGAKHFALPGHVGVWTGIPGHGKSTFLNFVQTWMAVKHRIRTGIFSPEYSKTALHMMDLSQQYSGLTFPKEGGMKERSSDTMLGIDEYKYVKKHLRDWFDWWDPYKYGDKETPNLLGLVQFAVDMKAMYGIGALTVDPFNKIDLGKGNDQLHKIQVFMRGLSDLAKRLNLYINLVAHPTKMQRLEGGGFRVPSMYDVSGSADFANMGDYQLTVHRGEEGVELHIWKWKQNYLGKPAHGGNAIMWDFDEVSSRYYPLGHTPIKGRMASGFEEYYTDALTQFEPEHRNQASNLMEKLGLEQVPL